MNSENVEEMADFHSNPDAGLSICIGDSSDQSEVARLLQIKHHGLLWSLGHLAL